MPTNLPPEYFEVEKRYREAKEPAEKAELLEELLGTIPKHKGTDHLRADLRRKLSKLKSAAQTKKSGGRRDDAYHIRKEGAGQAILVGLTNVGKSALLQALTNAAPESSPAPFTTWKPTPGMAPWENIQIQLVDTPPLNREYVDPALIDLIRRADVLLLMVDLLADPLHQLEEAAAILEENRIIPNHRRTLHEGEARLTFKPTLVVVNKCDDQSGEEIYQLFRALLEEEWSCVCVSAISKRNGEELLRQIFHLLEVVRVYSKAPGKEPDRSSPFILKKGSTVQEFAGKIHKDFLDNLRAARVWGSAEFDGQLVSRDYILQDGDVVELRA
jgi:ribosome-interacting GTPase 1